MLRNAGMQTGPRFAQGRWIAGPVEGLVAMAICDSMRFAESFAQRFLPHDLHGVHCVNHPRLGLRMTLRG